MMLIKHLVLSVLISLCFFVANGFVVPHPSRRYALISNSNLAAKKKQASSGQGFGSKAPPPPPAAAPKKEEPAGTDDMVSVGSSSPLQSVETGGSDAIPVVETAPSSGLDPKLPPEERAKSVLRDKYGLRTREEQEMENKRQQARKDLQKRQADLEKMAELDKDVDLMAMLPAPVLTFIDRFLKVGVTVCTVVFIAAGIAITAEAWANASGNPLSPDVDQFITNVVEPNFTPGLGVLLAFSVSLGVFAAAQLGSDSSQYREDN